MAYKSGQVDGWPEEIVMPEEAAQEYPELWKKIEMLLPNYSEEGRAVIVSIMVGTCSSCWSGPRDCRCWDDR